MCQYCNNEKLLINTSCLVVGITKDNYLATQDSIYNTNKVKIKYCPICGEELFENKK